MSFNDFWIEWLWIVQWSHQGPINFYPVLWGKYSCIISEVFWAQGFRWFGVAWLLVLGIAVEGDHPVGKLWRHPFHFLELMVIPVGVAGQMTISPCSGWACWVFMFSSNVMVLLSNYWSWMNHHHHPCLLNLLKTPLSCCASCHSAVVIAQKLNSLDSTFRSLVRKKKLSHLLHE